MADHYNLFGDSRGLASSVILRSDTLSLTNGKAKMRVIDQYYSSVLFVAWRNLHHVRDGETSSD
jgi:hypothetical protein